MRRRWFWLINGFLLLLYVWTLGEETAVSLQVSNGRCLASVPERSIAIDCSEIGAGSQVGLYTTRTLNSSQFLNHAPLHWLAPHTAWSKLSLFTPAGQPVRQQTLYPINWAEWQTISGEWATRWGALHGTSAANSILLQQPVSPDFNFTASLRRAEDDAGLLLLAPDGKTGVLFMVHGNARRGVWWQWENGRPTIPIIGIPFQKPFLQQAQSLLRLLLTGHQAALLLLAFTWMGKKAGTQRGAETARRLAEKLISDLQPFGKPRSGSAISIKIIVVILTLLTFGFTTYVASDVLSKVPHVQDSVTYLFQAETLARGKIWSPAPTLPEFFEQEFLLVQDGRWFGKYPPGYPAVLALGVLLKATWLINPLLATLTVPLLYQLGRCLYNGRIGLLAAVLLTFSPFFLFMSGSQMAHAAELFWLTLFMVCWHRLMKGAKPEHRAALRRHRGAQSFYLALLAGMAAGMAILTRQLTAVAIVAPFFLLTTWQSPLPRRHKLEKCLIWLAGLLPLVALLFAHQWAVTGDPLQDPRLLFWSYDKLGFGDDVGEPSNLLEITVLDDEAVYAITWRTDPSQPPRGHTPQRGLYNILRNWESLQVELFGWLPLLTFSFLWLAFLLKRPASADWLLLLTLLTLLTAEDFYWHPGLMYGPRYLYGSLGILVLLTARGAQALAQWLKGRLGWWLTAVTLTLLILGNIFIGLPERTRNYRGFNFVAGDKLAEVEASLPADEPALILVTPLTGSWSEYGELFVGNTPWLDGRFIFARDLGDAANRTLQALYPEHTPYRLQNGELIRLAP